MEVAAELAAGAAVLGVAETAIVRFASPARPVPATSGHSSRQDTGGIGVCLATICARCLGREIVVGRGRYLVVRFGLGCVAAAPTHGRTTKGVTGIVGTGVGRTRVDDVVPIDLAVPIKADLWTKPMHDVGSEVIGPLWDVTAPPRDVGIVVAAEFIVALRLAVARHVVVAAELIVALRLAVAWIAAQFVVRLKLDVLVTGLPITATVIMYCQ